MINERNQFLVGTTAAGRRAYWPGKNAFTLEEVEKDPDGFYTDVAEIPFEFRRNVGVNLMVWPGNLNDGAGGLEPDTIQSDAERESLDDIPGSRIPIGKVSKSPHRLLHHRRRLRNCRRCPHPLENPMEMGTTVRNRRCLRVMRLIRPKARMKNTVFFE